VLCCQRTSQWKIADFGITAEFTSKSARTTKYARGSENYLAPELLAEHAIVTRKTDIWGLGCILYELGTGKTAFSAYGNIREYSVSGHCLRIPDFPFAKYAGIFLADTINELLAQEPTNRPDAPSIKAKLDDPSLLLPTDFQKGKEWASRRDKALVPVRFLGKGSSANVFEVVPWSRCGLTETRFVMPTTVKYSLKRE